MASVRYIVESVWLYNKQIFGQKSFYSKENIIFCEYLQKMAFCHKVSFLFKESSKVLFFSRPAHEVELLRICAQTFLYLLIYFPINFFRIMIRKYITKL